MTQPLSSIATDPASPHYGHDVLVHENSEGRWTCLTCEPGTVHETFVRFNASIAELLAAVDELEAAAHRLRRRLEQAYE
jgi:hypothetical protein